MSREIDIHTIRSRPRFKIKTSLSRKEFRHKLDRQFRMQSSFLGGYIGNEFSIIRCRSSKQKYWAPQLQIRTEVDEDDPNLTVIRGIFGPRPSVWTLFMFLYILGGTVLSFFAMLWVVEYRIHVESNLIIWAWIGGIILFGTYMATKVGQLLAKDEIKALKDFMEKVVDDELENESYT